MANEVAKDSSSLDAVVLPYHTLNRKDHRRPCHAWRNGLVTFWVIVDRHDRDNLKLRGDANRTCRRDGLHRKLSHHLWMAKHKNSIMFTGQKSVPTRSPRTFGYYGMLTSTHRSYKRRVRCCLITKFILPKVRTIPNSTSWSGLQQRTQFILRTNLLMTLYVLSKCL